MKNPLKEYFLYWKKIFYKWQNTWINMGSFSIINLLVLKYLIFLTFVFLILTTQQNKRFLIESLKYVYLSIIIPIYLIFKYHSTIIT